MFHETELDFRVGSKDPSKTNDKKAVFLTEVAEGSEYQAAEEYDGGDSDYEVLLAAAHELGVGEPPEELEEDEARGDFGDHGSETTAAPTVAKVEENDHSNRSTA